MVAKRSLASKFFLVLLVSLVAIFLIGAVADAHRVPGCKNETPLAQNPHCAEGHHGENPGECSDGEDNDGDGLIDEDDPDCGVEPPTECEDGVDNDNDGATDEFDRDCTGPDDDDESGSDEPECSDGVDNDRDGKTDFGEGGDPDCESDDDDTEAAEPPTPACSDGIDNDGDGLTDGDDPGCADANDDDETDEVVEPTCGDPDGDGVDHSAFDPDSNEGGPISSIVHEVDQAIPSPLAGDQGVVTEVNCALVVTVEELLGING